MAERVQTVKVQPEPDSRLAMLAAEYAAAKPAADAAAERLKAVTDAIKYELTIAAPGAECVELHSTALTCPLRLTHSEPWRIDTNRLKIEQPLTYAAYAIKGSRWELRAVTPQ